MQLFYQPDIQEVKRLNEEESRHAIKVLRLQEGEVIFVVDGKGNKFECRITQAHEKKCAVEILKIEPNFGKHPYYFHLVIAPTKNLDRIEWMVEKCVEIGIDEISFIQTRYSERKELKTQRIEKIAIGAMKQSLKGYLPKINEMVSWKKFIEQPFQQKHNLMAHLEEGERLLLKNMPQVSESCCVLIGPEGDFSVEEISQALAKGFKAVSLGESRLRTETAGLVACHTVHLINS